MKDKLIAAFGDEAMHEAVRVAAFEERCSMSELVRRAIQTYLAKRGGRRGDEEEDEMSARRVSVCRVCGVIYKDAPGEKEAWRRMKKHLAQAHGVRIGESIKVPKPRTARVSFSAGRGGGRSVLQGGAFESNRRRH